LKIDSAIMMRTFLIGNLMSFFLIIAISSCKHDIPVPTSNDDNGGGGGWTQPCDPDSIYFENDIQPLLNTYCAKVGNGLSCHHANDAQDGVILDNFSNVINTGGIDTSITGDPFDNDFWDALNELDPDKQMPPPDQPQLTPDQLQMIQTWLAQGALNNGCACSTVNCDSTLVSFAADVKPIIDAKCKGCHMTANSGNNNVGLANYNDLVNSSLPSNRLLLSIRHLSSFPMPKNDNKLCDCDIAKISNWISEGALNN